MPKLARPSTCCRALATSASAVLLALAAPGTSAATVVRIENTAVLDDHSDRAIGRAIEQAVERSMDGATTLGLSSVELEDAVVLQDRVLVRVVGRDEAADQAQDDRGGDDVTVVDLGAGASEPR